MPYTTGMKVQCSIEAGNVLGGLRQSPVQALNGNMIAPTPGYIIVYVSSDSFQRHISGSIGSFAYPTVTPGGTGATRDVEQGNDGTTDPYRGSSWPASDTTSQLSGVILTGGIGCGNAYMFDLDSGAYGSVDILSKMLILGPCFGVAAWYANGYPLDNLAYTSWSFVSIPGWYMNPLGIESNSSYEMIPPAAGFESVAYCVFFLGLTNASQIPAGSPSVYNF